MESQEVIKKLDCVAALRRRSISLAVEAALCKLETHILANVTLFSVKCILNLRVSQYKKKNKQP